MGSGSAVTDHAYEPVGERWSICAICLLAEAAHERSAMREYPSLERRLCSECDTPLVDGEGSMCTVCYRRLGELA